MRKVWAVVNRWTGRVVAEVSHYQLAASVESDLSERWKKEFIGPQQRCFCMPFSISRIDALR